MKKILLLLALFSLLCGCGRQSAYTQELFAMDTVISLTIYGEAAEKHVQQAADMLREMEASLSVTREDSEIAQLNASGSGEVSDETAVLLQRALELEAETDGACSPSLYALTSLWGFTTDTQQVPCDAQILQALEEKALGSVAVEGNTVSLEGVQLDLGAFAKGYAAQRIADGMKAGNVEAAVLSLGGNVQTIGEKPDGTPWQIGVKDPNRTSENIGVLSLGEAAVVTSGGYQRYFESDGKRYVHILDPLTGRPVDNGMASVTVVAQDGLLADAFSTALYVMGLDKAVDFWRTRGDFEAVFVLEDGSVYVTQGLETCFESETFTVVER